MIEPVAILVKLAIGRLVVAFEAIKTFPDQASRTMTLSGAWAPAESGISEKSREKSPVGNG